MTDFGGQLRQARERRGVSLRQIAANTKISVAALEALERNDISRLPGGIFSRAFVRSYAMEVGLDPDETVREFLERVDAQSPAAGPAGAARHAGDSGPAKAGRYNVDPGREKAARYHVESYSVRSISEEESAFESRQRMASVLLKIIIASVVAAAAILYFTWRQTR